jgi:uncharacterized protein YfcZ (UPF0381/DUF406 family)
MNHLRKIFMVMLLLSVFAMVEQQASAQCYGCGVNPVTGCRQCEDNGPLGPGYEVCGLVNCNACYMKFVCELGLRAGQTVPKTALKFDKSLIRQIAGIHPRYAMTLAEINRQGGLSEPVRFTWSDVEVSAKDVEWWFQSKKQAKPFFARFAEKARQANKRGASQIVYDVMAIEQPNAAEATVKIQVITGTAADYEVANLEITLANVGGSAPRKQQWIAVDWRIDRSNIAAVR